jgi:hypothetical protein
MTSISPSPEMGRHLPPEAATRHPELDNLLPLSIPKHAERGERIP